MSEPQSQPDEWSLTPQPYRGSQPKRRGRGLIWSGVVLLVLAVVLGLAGIVGVGRGVGDIASGSTEPSVTPAVFTAELIAGRGYTLYEAPPSGAAPTLGPDSFTVTGADGQAVPLEGMGTTAETIDIGGTTFVAVAQFDAGISGTYIVEAPQPGTTVLLGPSLSQLAGLGLWGLAIGIAVLLGFVGLVLLVIGLVLRASKPSPAPAYGGTAYPATGVRPATDPYAAQSAAQPYAPAQPAAPPPPALPPAGWYPDPARPGGQRYWDGQQWTEHQA